MRNIYQDAYYTNPSNKKNSLKILPWSAIQWIHSNIRKKINLKLRKKIIKLIQIDNIFPNIFKTIKQIFTH